MVREFDVLEHIPFVFVAWVGGFDGKAHCAYGKDNIDDFGERDVVIFDSIDAEPLAPERLLSDTTPSSSASNLINVSLSRARGKLVILADVAYFRRRDPAGIISRVLAAAQRSGAVVTG